MTWWHRERSRRRRATRAIMKPRIDVCWGVQLCTGWWLNSRFVRHRQQTETSEKDRHQRRTRSRASLLYTLHGHRSFLIFPILRVPCIPPSIYPFVFFSLFLPFLALLLLSFIRLFSLSSFSIPARLKMNRNDFEWNPRFSPALFFSRGVPPISLVSRPSGLRSQFAFLYNVQVYSKKKKEKEKGKKKTRRTSSIECGSLSFLPVVFPFIHFVQRSIALLEMCWF